MPKPKDLAPIDSNAKVVLPNPDGIDPSTPGSRRQSYMVRYPTGRKPSEMSPNGAPTTLLNLSPDPTPKGPSVVAARRESQLTPKTPKYTPMKGLLPADESDVPKEKKKETRINALGQEEEVSDEDSNEYTSSSEEEEVRSLVPYRNYASLPSSNLSLSSSPTQFIPRKRVDRSMSVHALRLRSLIKEGR